MIDSYINSYGHRKRIHLYYQPRKTKGRGTVHHYSLATCYTENGKNKKNILQPVGELTKQEADQYRFILKALNGQIAVTNIVDFDEIIYKDEKGYLDCLVLNALWKKFGLEKLFDNSLNNNQKISTENVARILVINKMLDPTSKIKTISWLQTTLLPTIVGIKEQHYERNKIFRELTKIHKHKRALEKLFLNHSRKNKGKYEAYYFDGSTSWFEGNKCSLAKSDLEKTRGFYPQVVGLMLMTDNQGFPIAWEVVDGHTRDTSAFKEFIKRISNDYGVKEITYCFDRGVASLDNFDLVADYCSKFITGIKDNQIKDVFNLERFKKTRIKITDRIYADQEKPPLKPQRRVIDIDGFYSLDDNIFFKDLGVIKAKRYIVSFNFELFIKEGMEREARIEKALLAISEKNHDLATAKKDRDYNVTEREIIGILTKNKVKELFEYTLLPITTVSKAQSFKVECKIKKSKIEEVKLTDGVLVYITDHIEKKSQNDFVLAASDIISHYKGKHVVENAFRELKSFLEIRPFNVWTEDHVKAHYDIAIIAYFLNTYIYRQLGDLEITLRGFYKDLKKAGQVVKVVAPTGLEVFKMKKLSDGLKTQFSVLGISDISSPNLHKSHGVFQ